MTISIIRPSSTGTAGWTAVGSATRHEAIDDVVEQPDAPDLDDYMEVTSAGNSSALIHMEDVDPFEESEHVVSAKLWVYAETINTRTIKADLAGVATGNILASISIPSSTPAGWFSAEYKGRLSRDDIASLFLGLTCTGSSGDAGRIYAAYIEITTTAGVPTRFYLCRDASTSGTSPVSPGFDSLWDTTGAAIVRRMHTDIWTDATAINSAISLSKSSTSTDIDVLLGQWISDPLIPQTISGTLKAVMSMNNRSDMVCVQQLVAKVVSNDGSVVRGILYAGDTASVTDEDNSTTGIIPRKFPRGPLWPVNVNPVNAQDGDRIVVEIGYRALTATSSNLLLYPGNEPSITVIPFDHREPEPGSTRTDHFVPWFELSHNIKWKIEGPTRFLFARRSESPISPAFDSEWDATGDAIRAVTRRKQNQWRCHVANNVSQRADKVGGSGGDMLIGQFISLPLAEQTIGGTVKGQFIAKEGVFTDNNARSQAVIRVVSNDGSVVSISP